MARNPVIWFEIHVQDMDRAKQFYESVFQAKLERIAAAEMDMWGFPMQMDQAGTSGALVKMEGVRSGGNSTIVYFTCDDCSVEEARAEKLGAKIHQKKMSIGEYGYISLLYDTEGNMIGLHSMK
jgi:predicted enzyme related to lactoylglutathione lyase